MRGKKTEVREDTREGQHRTRKTDEEIQGMELTKTRRTKKKTVTGKKCQKGETENREDITKGKALQKIQDKSDRIKDRRNRGVRAGTMGRRDWQGQEKNRG